MTFRLTPSDAKERITRVRAARTSDRSNFCALVERAGLDPSKDLRFGNWSGVNFSGCELAGYDFTGSVLIGCKFDGARIRGAEFKQCEYGRADSFRIEGWRLTFESTSVTDIASASDWKEAFEDAIGSNSAVPQECPHLRDGARFRDDIFGPLMTVLPSQAIGVKMRRFVVALSDQFDLPNEVVSRNKYGNRDKKPTKISLSRQLKIPPSWRYREIGVVDWVNLIGVSEEEVVKRFTSRPAGFDPRTSLTVSPGYEEAARECGIRFLRFVDRLEREPE